MVPVIELRNVVFGYGQGSRAVLENINFAVGQDRLGIIGPNGCGKTSLFKIIMGLEQPQSGDVVFAGKVIRAEKEFRELRRRVGFLFQNSEDQLFSPTVLEDVAFGPLNLGKSVSEARYISLQTLDRLGLTGLEDRVTHKLSGGEKKLVALATILSMEPELLLLDEPANNLDPATRDRLITILRDLKQAYVIISHDLDLLASTCSQLYTIENRQVLRCREKQVHSHEHIHPYGDRPHKHGM